MRKLTLLLTFVLASCTAHPVYAARIFVFGDSIAKVLGDNLPSVRVNDQIINAGLPGDRSTDVERFYREYDAANHPDITIMEAGTNDPLLDSGITPLMTWKNLRMMARYAAKDGSRVLILTPPPTACKRTDGEPCIVWTEQITAHTTALYHLLFARPMHTHGVTIVDTREQWHHVPGGWYDNSDSVHPTGNGITYFVKWVSEAIDQEKLQ